jgi:hypothetical protein
MCVHEGGAGVATRSCQMLSQFPTNLHKHLPQLPYSKPTQVCIDGDHNAAMRAAVPADLARRGLATGDVQCDFSEA